MKMHIPICKNSKKAPKKHISTLKLIPMYTVVILLTVSDFLFYTSYPQNSVSVSDTGEILIRHIKTSEEILADLKNTHSMEIVSQVRIKSGKEHNISDSEMNESVELINQDFENTINVLAEIDCTDNAFLEVRQKADELYRNNEILYQAYNNGIYDDMKYIPYAGGIRNISESETKSSCYGAIQSNKKQFDELVDGYTDYYKGYFNLSEERKKIVETALTAEGNIDYLWGIKPVSKILSEGYDCSGFVQWVYWNAEDSDYPRNELYSTLSITTQAEQISYDELLPGDLGVLREDGSYYLSAAGNKYYDLDLLKQENISIGADPEEYTLHENHVGIYVGKDSDGNDIWCHCRGGSYNTVVVDHYDGFKLYYRVLQ